MCESEFNLIYLSRDNFDILYILIVAVGYNEFEFIIEKFNQIGGWDFIKLMCNIYTTLVMSLENKIFLENVERKDSEKKLLLLLNYAES